MFLYKFECLEEVAHTPKPIDLYFQWNLASSHFVRCGCADEPVQPAIANEAVHVREQRLIVGRCTPTYVRKVKQGNLEQYFVFRTLYSDNLCWMSDKVFIYEVHLAQSQYSRQT